MKRLIIVLIGTTLLVLPLAASATAHSAPAEHSTGEATAPSPLTEEEQALAFDLRYRRLDDHGAGHLVIDGEPLSPGRLRTLSPWDLMEVVQILAGVEWPLSRFGRGNGDELTMAWRERVAAFAAGASAGDHGGHAGTEDLFDPGLVLWDPGTIQFKNEWGQWAIRIDGREIVQSDLATLSPLEVSQAVTVLTARTYPLEFVLANLEAFRSQLSIVPRAVEPLAAHH